jgi:TonB-linked SusC/RagA family outer membrane protein
VQISFAQEKTITGTVVDETNMPLPGATVLIKGTTTGASTDFDGKYSISANEGDVLTFSYVGYSDQNSTVGSSNSINISLALDASLDEVVVVGYSSKKRSVLSSAVSTVNTEQLQQVASTTNIAQALQGQASGVNVVAQNGKPGQTAFVQIRGVSSSDPNQQPLYILDGAPISANDLNLINNSDVESVSILKDAATAAMYGSSAAAGVVVITTKGGKRNQAARFNFSSTVGFTQKIKDNFEMMNASQKLRYERELGEGTGAGLTDAQIDALEGNNQDWQKTLLRKGFVRSNSISMQGGSEKIGYFMSLKDEQDTGIVDGLDGYERTTARLNLNFDAKDWLSFDAKTGISFTDSQEGRDRNNVQNPFRAMYDYNPYETLFQQDADGNVIFDENGNPEYNLTNQGFSISEAIRNNVEDEKFLRFNGSLGAKATIIEGLEYRPRMNMNYRQYKRESFIKPSSVLQGYVGDADAPGIKTDNGNFVFDYTIQNVLNYTKTISEKHNFSITALTEYRKSQFDSYSLTSKGFPTDDIDVQTAAADADGTPSTTKSELTKFSYAGSLDYDYDEKYIFTASIRRDGSSRFGTNNQFGTFWATSLAWNIAKESFLEGKAFDDLKLRASYGTLGNDGSIGRYPFQDLYRYTGYQGQSAAFNSQTSNLNLQWEDKSIFDVGVEFSLFDRRLRGLVDYYKSDVSNLLIDLPLAFEGGGAGSPSVNFNSGAFETQGLEIELAGDIIKNDNWKWTAGFNIGFAKTEVTELEGGNDIIKGSTILREGEEVYTHYLVRYAGVNPANGEALYYDKDGNVTNVYSADDAVALTDKSVNPDFTGNFTTSLSYKGFDVNANFYFKYGNYVYNNVESNMLSDGSSLNNNQRLDAFNYWQNPGDTGVLPNPLLATDTNQESDRFLQDASYIRLRSAQIGYTLPSKFSEKLSLKSLRMYVQGQNLWTYAPYFKGDPEVGIGSGETAQDAAGEYNLYSYPTLQSFLFGVDISF